MLARQRFGLWRRGFHLLFRNRRLGWRRGATKGQSQSNEQKDCTHFSSFSHNNTSLFRPLPYKRERCAFLMGNPWSSDRQHTGPQHMASRPVAALCGNVQDFRRPNERIHSWTSGRNLESCLMQDEPERGVCFSHKMSLKGRGVGMLGIDRPRAKRQQVEPATDPAVSPLQRRDSIQRQRAGRDLRLGGAHAPPARLQPPEPRRQRAAAAVSGQDDRTEPGRKSRG